MADDNITKSELVQSILQQANLASSILDAVKFNDDMQKGNAQFNIIKADIATMLPDIQGIVSKALKTPYQVVSAAIPELTTYLPQLLKIQRDAMLWGRQGWQYGASMMSIEANLYAQRTMCDLNSKILFEMPMSYVQNKAQKFYNSLIAPEDPSEHDLYTMQINGMKTETDRITKYREDLGLSLQDAKNLVQIRNWQWGVPSLKEAWVMVQRGWWKKEDWLKLATLGAGFTPEDAENMFKLMNYEPTWADVMNLSTLIPLDPVWVAQKFKQSGMSTADQQVFIASMNKSTILKEIRAIWSQILSVYAYGGATKDEITKALVAWQFPQSEIDIKLVQLEFVKNKTVNQLNRDSNIYLYRNGVLSEIELYDRLIAQGIPMDVANAITRNEACKKGNDWELPSS